MSTTLTIRELIEKLEELKATHGENMPVRAGGSAYTILDAEIVNNSEMFVKLVLK